MGHRARTPIAFIGPEEDAVTDHIASAPATLYTRTESGLSYKDLVLGDEEPIASDAVVTIKFSASIVESNEVVQKATMTFIRGTQLELFDEAIEGMRVGGTRRVIVPPSSKYAALDENIAFEIECVGVKQGNEKLLYRAGQAAGAVARLGFWYVLADQLVSLVLPPAADGSAAALAQHVDAANAWAAQGLSAVGLM